MRRLILALVMVPNLAIAEDWERLAGDAIASALTSRVVIYPEGVAQDFMADGRTIKAGGRGQWRIEDDKYCVRWPPFEIWECFTVDVRGIDLRFITERGEISFARYGDL